MNTTISLATGGSPPRLVESPSGASMMVDGRQLLCFGGSAYLGLGGAPELVEIGCAALRQFGASTHLPRHYGFSSGANQQAEAEARRFFGTEAAMYFGTGYLFGLVALTGLAPDCDVVYIDESAHYSLREGAHAAGKPIHSFAHRDVQDLARMLGNTLERGQRPLVATDGVFATTGAIAPLSAYAELIAPFNGWLVVDESHAFGTIGPQGRGSAELAQLPFDRLVIGGSTAKALGAHGGFALGDAQTIAQLWRTPVARGAVLGCSAGAAMTAESLRLIRRRPELLLRLRENARSLKAGLRGLGLKVEDNAGPIAAFVHGDGLQMQRIQRALWEQGIFVAYSTYVGAGPMGVLRCAAFADHTPEQIAQLLGALRELL
ncbi:aminotransferase class I/II-fold pyridoxal phosphate-dependent enzyme [Variovorax sp. CY25R-8]|jgi:7-keto-8-aminopelargonate synthetase-like enzyme|uniref:aminotransferase class I/II-fold pyridoxal phosphate-dependent enzyme n=1 Tax=Variovorax sp. CY25R-8 TaxID=2855501 RepID=UPI0021BAB456|nr:pyridoxal phosphate-dependent aminotransferase family protein [Variovorax sp. CY25R-8]MCT8180125.1 pyridoxal phosphate-dependent aminotransferase family protein [Variovorax sp. CY25R-8]